MVLKLNYLTVKEIKEKDNIITENFLNKLDKKFETNEKFKNTKSQDNFIYNNINNDNDL